MSELAPSQAYPSFNVRLLVTTSLTATVSKPDLQPGESFNITGILTRDDTGAAVPNADIWLYNQNDQLIAVQTTDIDGIYMFLNLTAPSAVGSYTYTVEFEGGTGFVGSQNFVNARVGLAGVSVIWPLLVGSGLLFISKYLEPLGTYQKIKRWFKK